MKLHNKMIINIIKSLAVAIALIVLFYNITFQRSFETYLKNDQQRKFNYLYNQISEIVDNAGIDNLSQYLLFFVESENISMTIEDVEGEVLFSYEPDQTDTSLPFVERDISILDDGSVIGNMKIGYYDNSYLTKNAVDFQKGFFRSLGLASVVALIVGVLSSFYMSRNISKPIISLSNSIEKIKNRSLKEVPEISTDIVELNNLRNTIVYLFDSLQAQEAVRKNYAQDIAHEFRTPLTNLKLHIEAVSDGVIEMDDDVVNTLSTEINHLNQLIEQLKHSFNDDIDQLNINLTNFCISDVLILINKAFAPTAESRQIKLKSIIAKDVYVTMDDDKLLQVMYNLLSNAIKATPQYGVIEVRMMANTSSVTIQVQDNGIGISEEDQKFIFERFFRVDDSRTTKMNGSGLGLSITKNMVSLMKGTISVQSQPGKGSIFEVILPTQFEKGLK